MYIYILLQSIIVPMKMLLHFKAMDIMSMQLGNSEQSDVTGCTMRWPSWPEKLKLNRALLTNDACDPGNWP